LREKRPLQEQKQGWCGNIIKRSVVAETTPTIYGGFRQVKRNM
jgi:hypothetical protein